MCIIKFWKSLTWALLILLACLMPGSSLNRVTDFDLPHFDKVVHFGIFFILTVLLLSDFNKQETTKITRKKKMLVAALVAFAYGLAIELFQLILIQSRSAEVLDVFANGIGIILAVVNYKNINRLTRGYI